MSVNKVLPDRILSQSTVTAVINAPLETIDIAHWLLNLPDKEYQRCARLTTRPSRAAARS